MLHVKNISTGYGKRQVLHDISFEVKEGEIVLLIGSNGSGKSTLLKAIYGLLPPFKSSTGNVIFNGKDITNAATSDLIKKGLMYIPQKNFCFDNLTVKENLDVASLTLVSKKRAESGEVALQTFSLLKPLLKRRAVRLSGGERQILALAMASLHQPKMILLDEPFTGLSNKNLDIVSDFILKLNSIKTTFLIVEHRIKEAVKIGNRIIGLKMGKVMGQFPITNDFETSVIHNVLI